MKYVHEYRDPNLVRTLSEAIHKTVTKPWTIMEICGGQTHSIMKYGLHSLLPQSLRLIHGPGCPVCVTPTDLINRAISISKQKNTILCSFGDMLRVPGSRGSLLTAKAQGADIRLIISPLEAVRIAMENPLKQVVLFAIGFETTAPANGLALDMALQRHLSNFSLLVSHVLVPPAIDYLLEAPDNEVQGFLAAGHVCTVTGYSEYHSIAKRYHTPIVVTGFEPVDILQGLYACILQLEKGVFFVSNQYARSVTEKGNLAAQQLIEKLFYTVDREWRGIGTIPKSGLGLRPEYIKFDAAARFPNTDHDEPINTPCISGLILQGKKRPSDCPHFGSNCTPERPYGAPMVSSEGACSAYYHYHEKASV